jgi:hypothetical protein
MEEKCDGKRHCARDHLNSMFSKPSVGLSDADGHTINQDNTSPTSSPISKVNALNIARYKGLSDSRILSNSNARFQGSTPLAYAPHLGIPVWQLWSVSAHCRDW